MEGIALVLLVIFGSSIAQTAMRTAEKRRADTVRLLEEALRNPQVDRKVIDDLARQLTGNRVGSDGGQPVVNPGLGFVGHLFLAIGWFGLFVAVGLLIGSNYGVGVEQELLLAGWIVALVSFGCLTYPFAVREARARVVRN
jgi:hypothetical protein